MALVEVSTLVFRHLATLLLALYTDAVALPVSGSGRS
jgi:hypothetical protein